MQEPNSTEERTQAVAPSSSSPSASAVPISSELHTPKNQPGQERGPVSALAERAEQYLAAGAAQQSVALLENALADEAQDLRLFLLLGRAREALGDEKGALDIYLTIVEKGAWNPAVEAALVRDDFLGKTYPHSVAALLSMTARRETVVLWRRLAQLCEARGDDENARGLVTQAVQVNSEDVASLSILARICERQQKLEEAAEWHRRILRVHPGLRVSLLFLAQRHYRHGEYAQAIAYFEQLRSQERGNRLGELYWLLSQIRYHGISGLEDRIGEVMQWQDLQAEEQPLAQELFVAAGGQSLHEKHFAHAEQYFSHAYHILPSADIARLLAVVEKRRNRAQQENQVLGAQEHDQWTMGHDPSTPAPARRAAQERAPHTTADDRRRWEGYKGAGLGGALVLLLLVGGVFSVRQMRERQPALPMHQDGPPAALQEQPTARQEEGSSLRTAEKIDHPVATETSAGSSRGADETLWKFDEESQKEAERIKRLPKVDNPGKVTTAAALGLRVSGAGRADPARSLAAIQAEVEGHLSDLGAMYDTERGANPALMGSLVLDLTIEPDGRTSRVRLQSTELLNQGLQKRVLALAHTWSFSPAAGPVRVAYPLLFLPPEIDPASILSWERGTGRVRGEESILPSVPYADAEDSVARAKPEETRQKASYSNTLVFGNEAGTTQADAEHKGEAASGASVRSGHHFVHPVVKYSITPPAGFTLVRIGQRTVWQGPEGTRLLVETTLSPGPSARSGWEQLHAAFIKKYRNRYRSHGITETHLAGRPAAAWEFALTTAAGTTYKRDVAVLDRGVGYGILVSGPAERFAAWQPQFEAALQSFRLPLKRPGA